MTGADFDFVAGFVRQRSGLVLGEDQSYLVQSRLDDLSRRLGVTQNELLKRVRLRDAGCELQLVQALTVNETSFFRDRAIWERLRTRWLPAMLESREGLRVWSAACSTGQEPYSFSMLWTDSFPGRRLELLATDLSQAVLERARRGAYNAIEMARGLTEVEKARHFSAGVIAPCIRSMVEFRQANLLEASLRLGPFDLIMCRNVLIYFDRPTRERVLAILRRHLTPDGRLLVGASEVLDKQSSFRFEEGLYRPV